MPNYPAIDQRRNGRTITRHTAWLGIAALLGSGIASAGHVTVSGVFTSFRGLVTACDPNQQIVEMLNGQVVCSALGEQTLLDAPITPSDTVVFQDLVLGTPDVASSITFIPAPAQEVAGKGPANMFLLGTIKFVNGIWSSNQGLLPDPMTGLPTADAEFGITFTTHCDDDPTLDKQTLLDTVVYVLTSNDFANNTPGQNADFIYVLSSPSLGSLRAYELQDAPPGFDNTMTVQVMGHIDSLHLDAFVNPVGGFIDPSIGSQPTATPPVTVPGVVGMTQSAANASITAAGLRLGTLTQQHSTSVTTGIVISESPITGTSVAAGSAVNIVVSSGPLPGDVNGDGAVNCADLAIVKASFGKRKGQAGFDPRADVNGDGVVSIVDLSTVARSVPLGTTCN
jgi:Dockerin type I domain/PASTA domain